MVAGDLQPIIDTSFPMAEAQAAHDYVAANRNTGKVILTLA
ncbi:MAG: zinc-binding dehydrogenase [Anaerolineales bacterium]|nr:zinc-binding dehydrogenase [Anaerolineales bacterium]